MKLRPAQPAAVAADRSRPPAQTSESPAHGHCTSVTLAHFFRCCPLAVFFSGFLTDNDLPIIAPCGLKISILLQHPMQRPQVSVRPRAVFCIGTECTSTRVGVYAVHISMRPWPEADWHAKSKSWLLRNRIIHQRVPSIACLTKTPATLCNPMSQQWNEARFPQE